MSLFAFWLFSFPSVGKGRELEAGWVFGCCSGSTQPRYPSKVHVYHLGNNLGGRECTLSLRSHKNLSLCALLCMNTPSKCPVSTDRISIAFSPQPMIWLDRMYALERKQHIRTGRGQQEEPKKHRISWHILIKNYLHVRYCSYTHVQSAISVLRTLKIPKKYLFKILISFVCFLCYILLPWAFITKETL